MSASWVFSILSVVLRRVRWIKVASRSLVGIEVCSCFLLGVGLLHVGCGSVGFIFEHRGGGMEPASDSNGGRAVLVGHALVISGLGIFYDRGFAVLALCTILDISVFLDCWLSWLDS